MALIGAAFFASVLIFPAHGDLATRYPLTEQLAIVMLPVVALSLAALHAGWRRARMSCALLAFLCWGLLSASALVAIADVSQRGFLLFGAFAVIELGIFVRIRTHMDTLRDTLEAAVLANNASVVVTGQAPSPRGGPGGSVQDRS
ncbi:MAG TPA: hypothetical protein VFE72_02855 [Lysobacter sp.]|nr:hypothetical protein [Lysobacter sp.]